MLKDLFDYLLGQLEKLLSKPSGTKVIHRRRRFRLRRFFARLTERQMVVLRWATLALIALCVVMFLVGTVKLLGYGMEYVSSALSSRLLRQTYYETKTTFPVLTASPTAAPPQATPAATPVLASPTPIGAAAPQASPKPQTLPGQIYENNPGRIVNSRFNSIRQQNRDIIGWLKITGMIDEPVVQRDNIFYMTHDYHERSNANGAIFLDEIINLERRPYTLILYGHNMRSGAVFGHLRSYEDLAFYKRNPFIDFDTIYEDGRYVIFSVAQLSVKSTDPFYLDVGKLISSNIEKRNEVLAMLSEASVIHTGVTARADDQVLLLVTCVGEDTERRAIAARRLREGETEADIAALVR